MLELNQVYHGDCLEILPHLKHDKSRIVVITDPPYGIKMDKGGMGKRGENNPKAIANNKIRNYSDSWDSERPSREAFDLMLSVSRNALIFGGNYFADILPLSTHWIVWDKLQTMPTFSDAELIWTNINRKSVKIKKHLWNGLIGKESHTRCHPTQKPVELMSWLIDQYTKPDDIILDPYAGSGTTGVAAINMGRDFILIEKEKKYYNIIKQRLSLNERPLLNSVC